MLFADRDGNIYDHPELLMVCRRGKEFGLPRPDEIIPLPEESELFQLPGRSALGFTPDEGITRLDETAVAAFVSPGHTLSGIAAYESEPGAQVLPLFAYAAVGYADGRFWVAAKKVDQDRRQIFTNIPQKKIQQGAHQWQKEFPRNRLVRHLTVCALTYSCPAARNLALGRFEAPLPTSQACNADCVGCLSFQPEESGFPSTQNRITFRPTDREVAEVMLKHQTREKHPVYSFGQGCEGEPLTEHKLITEAIARFRKADGKGTVNINTNGSLTEAIEPLAKAGLDSIRVSMNSSRPELYTAYHRPKSYSFDDVRATIAQAKQNNMFVSLNLFYFPGVTDTEAEFDSLVGLLEDYKVDFIQLRNLNLDPELYMETIPEVISPSMGLNYFRKRLKKQCPWVNFGYFNPYLPDRPGAK